MQYLMNTLYLCFAFGGNANFPEHSALLGEEGGDQEEGEDRQEEGGQKGRPRHQRLPHPWQLSPQGGCVSECVDACV